MLVLIKTNHFYKPSDLFKKGKRQLRDQDEQGLPPGYAAKLYPAPSKKNFSVPRFYRAHTGLQAV